MLKKDGHTLAIVDTKWKVIGRNVDDKKRGVSQADVYQMMAYGQIYGASRLMLLYPAHSSLVGSDFVASHRIATVGGARLDIATIDVSTSRHECTKALRKLLGPLAQSGLSSAPADYAIEA